MPEDRPPSPHAATPPTPAQVLIVEDEPDHAEVMAEALRRPGHVCTIVYSVGEALDEFKHGAFDVIITDLRMPSSAGKHGVGPDGGDAGMKVLAAARTMQPRAAAIMVTAHGDVPTARAAFKEGVFDFIEKPLDLDVFRSLVNRAAEQVLQAHQAAGEGGAPLAELVQHNGFEGIIAGSEPMRRILHTVKTVAGSMIPVLITGESGTGKELIAKAVHRLSPRSGHRLVSFNCAGQAESLLEDQLFGHVRGAFTGAERDREGVFEYANRGTLFLDEIGDMPLGAQAKLLRVLETGEVVRLGSNETRKTDVRFVSATNKDLVKMTKEGTFREDLYFRIKGAHVHLPPLRERRDDIPRIVRHAIARFAGQLFPTSKGQPPTPVPDISDAAMMRLTAYAWPGNVRQLLNVVQNMVVTAIGESGGAGNVVIDTRHVPADISSPDEAADVDVAASQTVGSGSLAGATIQQIEKRAIRDTLLLAGGNREKAAQMLGIGERTLYRKLKEYGLR